MEFGDFPAMCDDFQQKVIKTSTKKTKQSSTKIIKKNDLQKSTQIKKQHQQTPNKHQESPTKTHHSPGSMT
jgi:hypothetical protein